MKRASVGGVEFAQRNFPKDSVLLQHFGILDSLLRVHPLVRTYMFSCVACVAYVHTYVDWVKDQEN